MSGVLIAAARGRAASGPVSVSISPVSQTESGLTNAYTMNSCAVTVTNGTASSYTWYFANQLGGTWAINAGQGTATATPRVTGVLPSTIAYADFKCDVVVNGVTYTVTCALSYENANVE